MRSQEVLIVTAKKDQIFSALWLKDQRKTPEGQTL